MSMGRLELILAAAAAGSSDVSATSLVAASLPPPAPRRKADTMESRTSLFSLKECQMGLDPIGEFYFNFKVLAR